VLEKLVERALHPLLLEFLEILSKDTVMKSFLKSQHGYFIVSKIHQRMQAPEARARLTQLVSKNL
jgi:hypothetical protein